MSRVTILIPTYKPSKKYALDCLSAIDAQTYRDFEVLIIDESDPETTQYLETQPRSFPLRVIRPKQRLGLAKSLNFGVRSSQSEFIARHDIDDICTPERLAEQVKFLDAHPEVSVVGSWTMKIGANNEPLGVRTYPQMSEDIHRQSGYCNPFCHSAVMLRSSFFDTYGFYREDYRTEDYELWFRALKHGAKMRNVGQVLVHYRIESNEGHSLPRYWREAFRMRWNYFDRHHIPTRLLGLTLTGFAAIIPSVAFDQIYRAFNRLR